MAKKFWLRMGCENEPGMTGFSGSREAAENSVTRGTVRAVAATDVPVFSWSSYTHASLVVLVNHEKAFCAVSVPPRLYARVSDSLFEMDPLLTVPVEPM